jgi:hypothetical protein
MPAALHTFFNSVFARHPTAQSYATSAADKASLNKASDRKCFVPVN